MGMKDQLNPQGELSERVRTQFYIDGRWCDARSAERLELVSPITENVILTVPGGCAEDMSAAVDAARRAFDTGPWPRMAPSERAQVLRRIGQAIAVRQELFARVWTAQVGATIGFTTMFSSLIPGYYDYYASLADHYAFEDVRKTAQGHARVVREPVGACALILPWNAPLILLSQKLAAGLFAGCTFVVKPSPETPLDALILAECAEEAGLPPGVLNIVPAGREAGDALIRDPRIDKVSFTGSTDAGRHIGAVCASRIARCSLELGGKSAAIICEDADLQTALGTIVPFAMPFSGQICFSQTRVLVPQSRHDEILDAYVEAVGHIRLGDPWDTATTMGPLSMGRQRDRVLSYIEKGRGEGARLVKGGGTGGFNQGYFVEPTIFDRVTPDMVIAQEEIFGPVVSILTYSNEEEAVAIANNSQFGLSGTVFSKDVGRAESIARRVRTGNISINGLQIDPSVPFGGFKQSGIGREGGVEGLEVFLEPKAIYFPA
ncbi:aldehyde dehydrogenase [Novosphingobium rosa]|uniref:aldehyde dehydrogenase n=1 Tax=Novosphingobium rosa TaxID=76978 RepID=UPI000AA50273|nr:aldehyde dehydrogenase [Novosphingobium rosa]